MWTAIYYLLLGFEESWIVVKTSYRAIGKNIKYNMETKNTTQFLFKKCYSSIK